MPSSLHQANPFSHLSVSQTRLKLRIRLSGDPGDGRHNMQMVAVELFLFHQMSLHSRVTCSTSDVLSSYLLQW